MIVLTAVTLEFCVSSLPFSAALEAVCHVTFQSDFDSLLHFFITLLSEVASHLKL